jgi:hypothetical protein
VVTLGDLVGKITMLEVACRRCDRRGRLQRVRLIEQHGDMRLPELRQGWRSHNSNSRDDRGRADDAA